MRLVHWLLLACGACLVAVGPAMALQEFAKLEDDNARFDLTGELPTPDTGFRAVWRVPLGALVVASGVSGTLLALRVMLQPDVRAVSRRLVALLFAGMTLLDVAYYADVRWLADVAYQLRGATVVWAYTAAGVLLAGSTHRLAELEGYFGVGASSPGRT